MSRLVLALMGLIVTAMAAVGCGSGASHDPNYKTEVKLTDAEKEKEKANMEGQQLPQGIDPKTGQATGPATLKVPGKG